MLTSKLKMLFCLTACLTVLFAPLLLEISQDGKVYAFSSSSNNKKSNVEGLAASYGGYTAPDNEDGSTNTTPIRVPEPSTLVLIGAGAICIAAAVGKKKFKKK